MLTLLPINKHLIEQQAFGQVSRKNSFEFKKYIAEKINPLYYKHVFEHGVWIQEMDSVFNRIHNTLVYPAFFNLTTD